MNSIVSKNDFDKVETVLKDWEYGIILYSPKFPGRLRERLFLQCLRR